MSTKSSRRKTRWRCLECGRFTKETLLCPRCYSNFDTHDDCGYRLPWYSELETIEMKVRDGRMSLDDVYRKNRSEKG